LQRANVEVWGVGEDDSGRVNLKELMEKLARRDVVSVLLEGGPTLNSSALRERIVDRVLIFLGAKIIGGQKALGMIGGEGVLRIQDALPVRIGKVVRLGPDLLIEGDLAEAE
jgi:diaminohydroxyphosphoribosylaminopyrimidine deaminase/5-amino-6-(5-phosphoribosylamino)uracil reductase